MDGLEPYFHAPIDRFVLQAAFGVDQYNGIPWSKLADYSSYLQCQDELKVAIATHPKYKRYNNMTVFLWELAEWPFGE